MKTNPDARLSIGLIGLSLMALVAFLWLGFGSLTPRDHVRTTAISRRANNVPAGAQFVDVAEELGLQGFRHDSDGLRSVLDAMAPGVGLLDLDGDEDMDIVALGGPGAAVGLSIFVSRLKQGERRFEDATERVGVRWRGAAHGICAGDYDADGDIDLFVTALGPNLLLQNRLVEDGQFTLLDVSRAAGVEGGSYHFRPDDGSVNPGEPRQAGDVPVPEFSTGASFGDFDRDGDLDLFVANYVSYVEELVGEEALGADRDEPHAFQPGPFPAQADRLYRNEGGGRFVDASAELGIRDLHGKGLGAQFMDIDRDGFPEIAVCNDASMNAVYKSAPSGGQRRFTDVAMALNLNEARSSRGLARGDADGDGDLDLVLTNWRDEPASLLLHSQETLQTPTRERIVRPVYEERSSKWGLAAATESTTGWGVLLFDYDNDGDQDCLVANGSTHPLLGTDLSCAPQRLALLMNVGPFFVEVSSTAGADLKRSYSARGLVAGDIDLDGDLDVVMSQNNGPLIVFENRLERPEHHALSMPLLPDRSQSPDPSQPVRRLRRDTIGVIVQLEYASRVQTREGASGGSYLSQGPFRLHFGMGTHSVADVLAIAFPYDGVPPIRRYNVTRNFLGPVTEDR